MANVFYGLANKKQLREYVVAVCSVLGYGGQGGYAVSLMMEVAAQETHCGEFRDPTPNGAGRGLFQMDRIAFDDVQQRVRDSDVKMIAENFGIDIRNAAHCELNSSPLLAAIFCRLFFKLLPDAIPASVSDRAALWKQSYNTAIGKGSAADYVANARLYADQC